MFSDDDLIRIGVEFEGTINCEKIRFKVWESKNSRILSRMTSSFEIDVWDLYSLYEWAYECNDKFEGTSVNHQNVIQCSVLHYYDRSQSIIWPTEIHLDRTIVHLISRIINTF